MIFDSITLKSIYFVNKYLVPKKSYLNILFKIVRFSFNKYKVYTDNVIGN